MQLHLCVFDGLLILFSRRISTSDPSHKTKFDCEPNNNQEWLSPIPISNSEGFHEEQATLEYSVKVSFSTDIYGTFRQSVVFDFGSDPVLVKHVCVDVVPIDDVDKLKEIKKVCACKISHFFFFYQ